MRVERPAKLRAQRSDEGPEGLRPVADPVGSSPDLKVSGPFEQSNVAGLDKSLDSLVVAVGHGDRSAFAQLFRQLAPRVKGYLIAMGAGPDQAEEITQDVMVAVWSRAGTFEPAKASATTWIYRIARNRRIDLWRREQKFVPDLYEPLLHGTEPEQPSQVLEAAEQAKKVREAVAQLPDELAHILKLAYFEGLTHREIALKLHLPLGTAKSRIRKATKFVRYSLDPLSN